MPTRPRVLLPTVLVLASLVTLACTIATQARGPRFTLAILRADGILIPFASYDGRWRNRWPEPKREMNVPIRVSDIPDAWWTDKEPVSSWKLRPLRGEARTIEVTRPVWFGAQCEMNVGLQTTYTPSGIPPNPAVQPYPKDGVAVSGDVDIAPITVVSKDSAEWKEMGTLLERTINEEEENASPPLSRAERGHRPVKLEVLVRAPYSGENDWLYYFEAVKEYPIYRTGLRQPCDFRTYASGWVRRGPDGKTRANAIDVSVLFSDCEIQDVWFMLPLGVIRLDDKVLWVAQWSGYGHEHYGVLEIRPDAHAKAVIQSGGGNCPR